MTTAAELLRNPNLDIDPITANIGAAGLGRRPFDDELAHFGINQEDIQKMVIKTYAFGKKVTKVDIRPFVKDCMISDDIDKTPTITITLHDPDWDLINSGALDGAVDINPGGIPHRWYRLDAFDVTDDDITLTFMTRNAVFLSMHKRPVKYSRGSFTRAEAILNLLNKVKVVKIKMYCPQLHKKQTQAKYNSDSERKKANERSSGFTASDKITVKNVEANPSQRSVISDVIEAGVDLKAPGLVIVAGVMTVIHESGASNNPQPPNPPYIGAFQQNRGDGWPATGNAYQDAKGNGTTGSKAGGWYGMAIPLWAENSDIDLGVFIATIQGVIGSTNPLNNGFAQQASRWRAEAQHAVNAYGGVDVDDPGSATVTSTEYRKKYEFMVGEPDGKKNENYLGAVNRWADEVNWRAYWVRDVLHFMSEDDLFKAKARIRLRRYENGIESVNFSYDRSKKVTEIRLRVRMVRWVAPVGTVVIWDEGTSKTGKGRWLVTNIRKSAFDTLGEVTLRKPMAEKKEPAPDTGTHSETEEPTLGGPSNNPNAPIRQRIIEIAEKSLSKHTGYNRYSKPGALTAEILPAAPKRTDCSQWVRAVYLAAGAPDPGTYTGDMMQRGISTWDPLPGDLLINSDHVELFVGGDTTYGHGTPLIKEGSVAYYRGRGMYFMTYDFLKEDD